MKKTSRLAIAILISISTYACSNSFLETAGNRPAENLSLAELKDRNLGKVTVQLDKINNKLDSFKTLGVDFSNPLIKKLKLDISGKGLSIPVSRTIDWTPGTTAVFSLDVAAGNNRIMLLSALDAGGNTIATLMGALNVTAGQANTGTLSFFETAVAQVLLNLLNTSSATLDTLNLATLKTFITNVTGYNVATNRFTKFSPALIDSVFIANFLKANNGTLPSETDAGLQASGSVKVNLNTNGAKIIISDLASAPVNSTTAAETTINNVSTGEWNLTVMKDGFTTSTQKINVSAGTTTNINVTLAAVSGPTPTPVATAVPTAVPTTVATATPNPVPTPTATPRPTAVPSAVPGATLFSAVLNGSSEVPANSSTTTGSAILSLNSDGTTASVSVTLNNTFTSNQTGAHIHGPAPAGVNAGILFHLPIGSFSNHQVTLSPAQLQQLRDGLFYINLHTANIPGGEIRGQLIKNN